MCLFPKNRDTAFTTETLPSMGNHCKYSNPWRLLFPKSKRRDQQRPAQNQIAENDTKPGLLPVQHSTSSNPAATFLGCPGEIRNQIYSYVFGQPTAEDMLRALQRHRNINPNTALLFTCRQIYEETYALARPNFLIVPKHEFFRVKTAAGLTLPLNDFHLTRILQGGAPPNKIHSLVLRDYLHNIILYWRPPAGELQLQINLQPKEVFIQLCICDSITWIINHGHRVSVFASAIEELLNSYQSIKRVVVYFCSLGGSTRIESQKRFPHLLAEAFEPGPRLMGDAWVAENVGDFDNSFLLTRLPGNVREPRVLKLDMFNSLAVCGKECVLL